jgi:hypothetical protein
MHDDFDRYRQQLIPKWIRFFSWFLLVFSTGVPLIHLLGLAYQGPMSFAFLGFRYIGRPTDGPALFIAGLLLWFGLTAYGILWGRDWGALAGIVCGIMALLSFTFWLMMFLQMLGGGWIGRVSLPVDALLAIPFLFWLAGVWSRWENPPLRPAEEASNENEHGPTS